MAASLWLTADERKIFEALPSSVREGWEISPETETFADTPEKRDMRLSLVRLHDPVLRAFCDKAKTTASEDAMVALIRETDMKSVSSEDLAELFFALGPSVLTFLAQSLLTVALSDTDLEDIEAILTIRHSLFGAFSSHS